MKIGDQISTNFFGNPPRLGVILGVVSNRYGIVSLHVLLSDAREVYFIPQHVQLV